MRSRQLDSAVPAGPHPAWARRAKPPAAEAGHDDVPGWPLSPRPVPGAGVPDLPAQAAALRRATGGRLARAGPVLVQLQRQRGNRYVQGLVSRAGQAASSPAVPAGPLVADPAGDEYEREADRVAGQVARLPAWQERNREDGATRVQSGRPRGGWALQAPGRALPAAVREGFEAAFGADFEQVRIHAGDGAARLSRGLGAEAFTHGRDVFFAAGRYAPATAPGRRLLAHELTHVLQQGRAAPGRPAPRGESDVPPVLGVRRPAPPGGPAELIQRKLSWQHTNWAEAEAAWSSGGGGLGVVFVTDIDVRHQVVPGHEPVVVKAGEKAPAEVVLAVNLSPGWEIGEWTVDAPSARAVDPAEGQQIQHRVRPMVEDDAKGSDIIEKADRPGTMVFEYAHGKDYEDLLREQQKHSEKIPLKRRQRRLRQDSPLRFFEDKDFVQSLGRIAAIDIFTGNEDRLTGVWNAGNFRVNGLTRTITLIDNVQLHDWFAFKTLQDPVLTSVQAYQIWVQRDLTQKLRGDRFAELAESMAETIVQGVCHVVRAKDQPTVRQLIYGAKDWLLQGLKRGKAELQHINDEDLVNNLTQGMAEGDKQEVTASIRQRLAYLFPEEELAGQ